MKIVVTKSKMTASSKFISNQWLSIFLLLIMILILPGKTIAQKTMYRTLGHQIEGSEGRNVVEAADGGYFMSYYIYYSSKAIGCLTKLNCAGQVEWKRFYEEINNALPVDIIAQKDNGCLMLISIRTVNGIYQNAVLRIDANGNTLWTQRVSMQAANTTGCMAQHADGSIYICGADSIPGLNHVGTTIARIDTTGALLWVKQYGEYVDHTPRVITVTSDHRIVVTGQAVISGLFFTNLFVASFDEDGDFIKRKIYTTYYDDEPHSICADASGNVAITGYSYFLNSQWDIFFLKLDDQLNILQSKAYDAGTPQGEQARCIAFTNQNTFSIFGDEGGFNERNPMMMKLDADGTPIWSRRYPISPFFTNYIFHGSQCSDNGFLMTGDARPASQFRIAPFIKTDPNGDMGCFNSNFTMAARSETFTVMDTLLLEYPLITQPDTTAVPFSTLSLQTSNTAFCQSLVPCGNFTVELDTICPFPCFTFSENSLLADSWLWSFENGNPATSTEQNPPLVCYSTPGPHEVILTFSNAIGSTTFSQFVEPEFECPFLIPNIFTPNGDETNDIFYVKGLAEPFSLSIFNRWGLKIFDSGDQSIWWNGESENGKPATSGVYFYILSLPESNRKFSGTVSLER